MSRHPQDEFDDLLGDGLDAVRGIVWWTLAVIVVGLLAWWWLV